MFGIQQGTNVLKEIHKEFNIENVERLLGENADAITYQKVWHIVTKTLIKHFNSSKHSK